MKTDLFPPSPSGVSGIDRIFQPILPVNISNRASTCGVLALLLPASTARWLINFHLVRHVPGEPKMRSGESEVKSEAVFLAHFMHEP
jgi:hypothetical protein